MNFPLFMARRLHREGGSGRVSRSAVLTATAGVALGLMVMILALSVALGFQQEVRNRIGGMGSHIQVLNYESLYTPESKPIQLTDSLLQALRRVPGVQKVQPFCLKTGMIKTDQAFQGAVFRGVDEEYDLSFLRSALVEGELKRPFSRSQTTGRLVISQRMASDLGLSVGSRLWAYFFDGRLRARRFTVEAVYATNLSEYDRNLVFCDYHTAHQLLDFQPDQGSGAELLVSHFDSIDRAADGVSSVVRQREDAYGAYYTAPTIRDLYPQIFSWLDLLDVNVLVILLLMTAVASFTAISGLLILILERTQFIGIMKALGASNGTLRRLFLWQALFIVLRGLFLGNVMGLGLCFLQKEFGLIHLDAETYYVDAVPVFFHAPLIVMLNVGMLLATVLALLLPSLLVSHIHPARSIRFE